MPRPNLVKEPIKPLIFNTFKYVGINSYDVIRHFKRNLPKGYGKIGHFGTLDPFACGVLLIAIGGATRLNEYIHNDLTKTYLAIGKLGVSSETGDITGNDFQYDEGEYISQKISRFDKEFIEEELRKTFLGSYMQAPHQYSAAKFRGRPMHQWAREGVEIVKDKVERQIYKIDVVRYHFPYLSIRVEVSSGTYVRTLFSDCARHLGTYGVLLGLVRESIGNFHVSNSLVRDQWPGENWKMNDFGIAIDGALPLPEIILSARDAINYRNGIAWHAEIPSGKFWVYDQAHQLIGLGLSDGEKLKTLFNLPQEIKNI